MMDRKELNQIMAQRMMEAQEHRKAGRLEQSAVCLREVVQKVPGFYPAWGNLAATLYELGRLHQALDCIKKAVEIKPDEQQNWLNKGSIEDGLKLFEDSLCSYKQVLKINPKNASAWVGIGRVMFNQDRRKEATLAFQQAARLGDEEIHKFLEEQGLLGNPEDEVKIGFREPVEEMEGRSGTCESNKLGIGLPIGGGPCANDGTIKVILTDPDFTIPYFICPSCLEDLRFLLQNIKDPLKKDRFEKVEDGSYIFRAYP